MYATLLLDVEDILTRDADDITRDVARLLSEEGVSATFCVVGERVRQWRDRDRADVVEALQAHDIGTHTDFHSVHPTVVEYLLGLGWDEGVDEAARRESPAVEAIRRVFDRDPSCWGGPGNTWGPQVNVALRRLGVPAVVYAHTRAVGREPHRFLGALAYPYGHSAGDGDYHKPRAAAANRRRLLDGIRSDMEQGLWWTEVFLGHPSRILHHEFWDGCNFAHGRNPSPGSARSPRRKSGAELAAALDNLRRAVREVRDLPGLELRTIREMNEMLRGAAERPLTRSELDRAAPHVERNVRSMAGWVILPPDLPMDGLWQLTRERLGTLRRLNAPS